MGHAIAFETPRVTAPDRTPTSVWPMFAVAVLLTVTLNWLTNAFILTPDVYARMLGDRFDASQVNAQLDLLRTSSIVGYAASPLAVWLRIALLASLLHMIGLVSMLDVKWRDMFRICLFAFFTSLMASAMRVALLWWVGAENITAATLQIVPGSLASLALDPPEHPSILYSAASLVSFQAVIWTAAIAIGLHRIAKVGRAAAAGVAVGLWALLAALQLSVIVFLVSIA